MKPTVGRIVHFVDVMGIHQAAIITAVGPYNVVNLTVFSVDEEYRVRFVSGDDAGEVHGTWHWPERE